MRGFKFKMDILAVLLLGATASSPLLAGECKPVQAEITDASSPQGCTSPFNFCAAGTVEGNLGLNGTTYFILDGVATGPATAPGYSANSGILVYTTHEGTLTVRETGIAKFSGHPSNGYGSGIEEVISGTGRFAGATGVFHIRQKDVNSRFHTEVTGQLCLAEDHHGE
jgi:hypothetical protein